MADALFSFERDPHTGFQIIGGGSLGGKTQGLGLVNSLLKDNVAVLKRYDPVAIGVPPTLVIGSSGFEAFMQQNQLAHLAHRPESDAQVAARFLNGVFPAGLSDALRAYLADTHYPLAVRSSGILEDLRFHAYAGLYQTHMLSNDQPDLEQRLDRLIESIKFVYASTFFEGPRAYAKRVNHQLRAGAMAVIIQKVVGTAHGRFYYPAISGVAQSRNYYPLAGMKAEDGLATIALGLGKQVVAGERALRFSPRYPKRLLQRGTVEEVLDYAQRDFYALEMGTRICWSDAGRDHLVRRSVSDTVDDAPVDLLTSTYIPDEHRIRDTRQIGGQRVLTFANVLKYDLFPLAAIVRDLLALGQAALGAVEMEFAADLAYHTSDKPSFHVLQMRPMTARANGMQVVIESQDRDRALCYSQNAMGNGQRSDVQDVVYIKPDVFDPRCTYLMVRQIAEINAHLVDQRRQYVLVGPGRWGSADPWMGIPVRWADISNVAAIVETTVTSLKVELSQGAHFFHNMTALGINYLCVSDRSPDFFDWSWLTSQKMVMENEFAAHVHLPRPMSLKVDGRAACGIILVER